MEGHVKTNRYDDESIIRDRLGLSTITSLAKEIYVHNSCVSATFAINRAIEFYNVLNKRFGKTKIANDEELIKKELGVKIKDTTLLLSTKRYLGYANLVTIGDLLNYGKSNVMKLRGIGRFAMFDLGAYLIDHNLSWDLDSVKYGFI